MVLPTYLTLSEATKRLANNTGESVTPEWLLQHAIDGRLQLFYILRQGFIADFDSASESCLVGTFLPLNAADAGWILAQPDNDWVFQVATVRNASDRTAWVLDWITGKRRPIEVVFSDLHVKLAEIDMLATSPSASSDRKKGEPNPADVQKAISNKLTEDLDELDARDERLVEIRRKEGRYNLEEAAKIIAPAAHAPYELILGKLVRAAENRTLLTYMCGSTAPTEFGGELGQWPGADACFEECYWYDLNKFLKTEMPLLDYEFPNPADTPAAKVGTVPLIHADESTQPWLILDREDPAPEQPWYTPARYFARQLVKDDSTLLTKRKALAQKVAQSLTNAGIKKRGGKKPLDATTVLKAFANVSLG